MIFETRDYWFIGKKSPAALFSEYQLRFRRQKRGFAACPDA
jgi:hypothetical protein